MTHNVRGHEMGKAKNGAASNRDNPPAGDFSLASGVLDGIKRPAVHRRRYLFPRKFPPAYRQLKPVDNGRLRFRTGHIVMANTVGIPRLAENFG